MNDIVINELLTVIREGLTALEAAESTDNDVLGEVTDLLREASASVWQACTEAGIQ